MGWSARNAELHSKGLVRLMFECEFEQGKRHGVQVLVNPDGSTLVSCTCGENYVVPPSVVIREATKDLERTISELKQINDRLAWHCADLAARLAIQERLVTLAEGKAEQASVQLREYERQQAQNTGPHLVKE